MEELNKTVESICNSIDKLTELLERNRMEYEKLLSDIDIAFESCKALHKSTE